jgi:hypothetical protein
MEWMLAYMDIEEHQDTGHEVVHSSEGVVWKLDLLLSVF